MLLLPMQGSKVGTDKREVVTYKSSHWDERARPRSLNDRTDDGRGAVHRRGAERLGASNRRALKNEITAARACGMEIISLAEKWQRFLCAMDGGRCWQEQIKAGPSSLLPVDVVNDSLNKVTPDHWIRWSVRIPIIIACGEYLRASVGAA